MGVTGASVLRNAAFRRLFVARVISDTGSRIATVAYAFAILDLTGSASDLGLTLLARTLPLLALILVGGVIADRFPRRLVMVGADTLRAVSQGVVALLLLSGSARLWELLVLQFAYGVGEALFTPAIRGITPAIVPPTQLQRANALLSFSRNTNSVVGPAIGGLLVTLLQPGAALAVDSASFAIGALLLIGIPATQVVTSKPVERFSRSFVSGWLAVIQRPWLSASLAGDAVYQLLIMSSLFVLGPLIAKEHLHGVASWSAILSALGVGSVVGDLLSLRIVPRRPLLVSRVAALGLLPGVVLLALSAPIAILVVAFAVGGLGFSLAGTLWFTLLQQNIPDDLRSRIASFDTLVSRSLLPVGYTLVGFAAGWIGAGRVLIVAAASMFVVQFATLLLPAVRSLTVPEYADLAIEATS